MLTLDIFFSDLSSAEVADERQAASAPGERAAAPDIAGVERTVLMRAAADAFCGVKHML